VTRITNAMVSSGQVADCLELAAKSFASGELAYLALTSKIERPLQDRLAWCLHTQFPGLVVSREWRATGIAILNGEATSPLLLLEAKAMYSFDVAWEHRPNASRYPLLMKNDVAKAHRIDQHDTADVYALGLVTHPLGLPRDLPGVIKYQDSIRRALRGRRRGSSPHGGTDHAACVAGAGPSARWLPAGRRCLRRRGPRGLLAGRSSFSARPSARKGRPLTLSGTPVITSATSDCHLD